MIYLVAIFWAVMGHGIQANQIAMVLSLVMIPLMVHGARHHAKRNPENERTVIRGSYLMVAWLIFAFIIHGLGALASPDSSDVYAIIPPLGFMVLVMAIVNLELEI